MKYYLHDSNAFNDEKITMLFMEYGYEGLGLFYTLLEKIASQEKPIKTDVLKSQLKIGKKLIKCWNFMENIELIHSNNGETFNKQLMNFSEKYKIKKETNAKRVSEWRKNQEDIKNVTHYESVRNNCKVKESKVKENKEVISIEKRKENFILGIDNYKDKYQKDMLNDFYNWWSELDSKSNKMRFEKQDFFEVGKRLATWKKRLENNGK